MNKYIGKISRYDMREIMAQKAHQAVQEAYSEYKIEGTIIMPYDEFINRSALTEDMKIPDDIYIFQAVTDLSDEDESWRENDLLVLRACATTYVCFILNYNSEDLDDEVFYYVMSLVTHPEETMVPDRMEIDDDYVTFVASHLNEADRASYGNMTFDRMHDKHQLEFTKLKAALELGKKQAAERKQSEQE